MILLAATVQGAAADRLDEMFATGPETLVAQAQVILAGSVSRYAKDGRGFPRAPQAATGSASSL
jgi:hypothetical protein